jgi:hypothetical protein
LTLDSASADNGRQFGNVSNFFFTQFGNVSNLGAARGGSAASQEAGADNARSVRHDVATFP